MPSLPARPTARRGRQLAESGLYEPLRGEYLGRIDAWGLNVYENSPREWIEVLSEQVP